MAECAVRKVKGNFISSLYLYLMCTLGLNFQGHTQIWAIRNLVKNVNTAYGKTVASSDSAESEANNNHS